MERLKFMKRKTDAAAKTAEERYKNILKKAALVEQSYRPGESVFVDFLATHDSKTDKLAIKVVRTLLCSCTGVETLSLLT